MGNPVNKALRVTYSPEVALKICELVASGETIMDIGGRDDMPSRQTIHRWLSVYPKFFDAMERAKEVSAWSFEEEALGMARVLKNANDFTGTKVQAYNIAMQQLRWSASRRDKARYGQQATVGNTTVPIQINTTLNLGQEGQPAPSDIAQSVYTVEVEVNAGNPFTEGYDEDTVEEVIREGEVLDLSANGDEDTAIGFGLPDHEEQQLHNPKPGRPRKSPRKPGHKSPAATKRTATMLAKKAAAAKKEDTTDGT